MSEICDRCGAEKGYRVSSVSPIYCGDCYFVEQTIDETKWMYPDQFLSWLERVIDRRIQKALAERRLP